MPFTIHYAGAPADLPRVPVTVEYAPDDTPMTLVPTWHDLTPDFREVSISRGSSSAVDVFDAGSATVVLDNTEATYHPRNPDSEFADKLRPGKQVRITAPDDHVYEDTGQRPDDSTDVGRLASGELWWQAIGSWEVDTRELGLSAAGSIGGSSRGALLVDVGDADGYVEFVVGSVAQDGMGATFRYMNAQNCWYIKRDNAGGRWQICKLVDNSETVVTNVTGATAVGARVRIAFSGDTVGPVTIDGTEVAASSATDDEFALCTLVGLFADGALTTARWRGFRAAVDYRTLFRGWVDAEGGWRIIESANGQDAEAVLSAVDILAVVAAVDVPEVTPTVGSGELSGARVARILDETSVTDAWRDLDLGLYTVQATAHGENALAEIVKTVISEGGALYAAANGRLCSRDRNSGIERERINGLRHTLADDAPLDDPDWTPADIDEGTVYWAHPAYLTDASDDPITDGGAPETLTPVLDLLGLGDLTTAADDPQATRFVYHAGDNVSGPYLESDGSKDRMSTGATAMSAVTGAYSVAALCRVHDWGSFGQWWSADGGELVAPDAALDDRFNLWDGASHLTYFYTDDEFENRWILAIGHLDPDSNSGYLEIGGYRFVNFTGSATESPTQFHILNHHDLTGNPRGGNMDGVFWWLVEGEFTDAQIRRAYEWAVEHYDAVPMPQADIPFDHPEEWESFATRVRNQIVLTADGLTDVEDNDATSQNNFTKQTLSRSGLILDTQADLGTLGDRLLAEWKDPAAGPAITILHAEKGGRRWGAAARAELRDRQGVVYRPVGFDDALSSEVIINSVTHRITSEGLWDTDLTYLPADRFAHGDETSFLVLDHPLSGRLDHNSVS